MIIALLLALIGLQTAPRPCSTADHRQFDFWIGDWDVKGPNGQIAGRNRIEMIEGGCGLQENWTSAGATPTTGRSINAYSAGDKKWHQIWLGSGGGLMHLSGTFQGDTLTMGGVTTTPSGQTVHNRLAFTKRGDGSVRQFWEQSADGKSWKTAFEGIYTRRP